jgi:hypothetical protein
MKKFKTVSQVWSAIDSGKKVYWIHKGYQVLVENDSYPELKLYSNRGKQMLRVTCLENWFGSRLDKTELSQLFIGE